MYGRTASASAGALPFTGMSLGWMVLGGVMAAVVAAAVTRLVPRREA